MRNLKWSDNDCTVGWTCVHAYMEPDDMRELLSEHPDGRFSATFYVPSEEGGHVTTPGGLERLIKNRQARRWCTQTGGGFYFSFPLDERGESLLRRHGLKTCKACDGTGWASDPGIGESCWTCGGAG